MTCFHTLKFLLRLPLLCRILLGNIVRLAGIFLKRTVALLVALFLTFGLASCNRPPQPPSASSGGPGDERGHVGAASSTLSTTDTTTTASTTTTAVTTTKRPSVTVPPVKKPGKTSPAKKPTVPVTKPGVSANGPPYRALTRGRRRPRSRKNPGRRLPTRITFTCTLCTPLIHRIMWQPKTTPL